MYHSKKPLLPPKPQTSLAAAAKVLDLAGRGESECVCETGAATFFFPPFFVVVLILGPFLYR